MTICTGFLGFFVFSGAGLCVTVCTGFFVFVFLGAGLFSKTTVGCFRTYSIHWRLTGTCCVGFAHCSFFSSFFNDYLWVFLPEVRFCAVVR